MRYGAVEQVSPAERAAVEDLPVFEGGLTPELKHFALVTVENCTHRVIAWTADEQLFAADLKLTKEKDGARARVLRDVTRRSPFERCLDHDLQAQVLDDVNLTAPAMRVFFSLPELMHLEKKPGALPEPTEVHALMQKCGAPPMAVHYQVSVEADAVVVEKPTFVPEDVTATVRACLEAGIARRVTFPPESRPGWTSARAEVKTHEGGVLTRSTMRFVK